MAGKVLRAGIALGVALAAYPAQTDLPRHLLLLARIKQKMAENLSRLPNYTCLQTMERSRRADRTSFFEPLDTVRLEVAQVGKRELFAWPGARQLEEKELREIVPRGLIGTGDFALHAQSIFRTSAPTFDYVGEERLNGHRAFHYRYRVPQLTSGYRISLGEKEAVVGYHGSFWADAESLELIRLEVRAEEFATELEFSSATTRIDYGKARIGNSDFLLPRSAELVLEFKSGAAVRNRTEFTGCRQYSAETVVTFELPGEPAPLPRERITEADLPAGLSLAIRLETVIDSQKSAVGDPLAAKVQKDARQKGKLLVPAGATVTGRIRRFEKHPSFAGYFVVGLEFSEIEFENTRARLVGELETISETQGITRELPALLEGQLGVGTFFVRAKRFQLRRLPLVLRTGDPGRLNR